MTTTARKAGAKAVEILGEIAVGESLTPTHAVLLGGEHYVYAVGDFGYRVRKCGAGEAYTVSCRGPKAVHCTCKAAKFGRVCKHRAGAEALLAAW